MDATLKAVQTEQHELKSQVRVGARARVSVLEETWGIYMRKKCLGCWPGKPPHAHDMA